MGIREAINKHQGVFVAIATVVVAVALYFSIRSVTASSGGPLLTQAYFTVDDGKTYFTDDDTKLAPFQHEGKEAYRAHVFKCGGTVSVQYLSRYTEAGKKAREKSASAGDAVGADAQLSLMEYKKPGEATWTSTAPVPQCPEGAYPEMVTP